MLWITGGPGFRVFPNPVFDHLLKEVFLMPFNLSLSRLYGNPKPWLSRRLPHCNSWWQAGTSCPRVMLATYWVRELSNLFSCWCGVRTRLLLNFKRFLKVHILHTHTTAHVWQPQDSSQESVLPFHHVGSWTRKLRSSDLAANAFAH